jgi:3-hydroxyisobutyrate dehydrogenase-like beta-hydroxyacid dehydrogenase
VRSLSVSLSLALGLQHFDILFAQSHWAKNFLRAAYLRGDFEPRFSLALARKDLGLAQELAGATDTPMPLSNLCEKEMIEAMARGWANRDASIFLTLQEERADVQVRLPPA